MQSLFRLHLGEEDNLFDGVVFGEQHHQPVDPDSESAHWGHPVFEGFEEVLIDGLGLFVAKGAEGGLGFEAGALVDGVVQLAEGVGEFVSGDHQFKAVSEQGIVGFGFGEGRDFLEKISHESRLDQLFLHKFLIDAGNQFPNSGTGRAEDGEMERFGKNQWCRPRFARKRKTAVMARAAAPMFPGWLGFDSTIRTLDSKSSGASGGIGKDGEGRFILKSAVP